MAGNDIAGDSLAATPDLPAEPGSEEDVSALTAEELVDKEDCQAEALEDPNEKLRVMMVKGRKGAQAEEEDLGSNHTLC